MPVKNPRFPHSCIITRKVESSDPMVDETDPMVIYNGACRAYEKNTTSVSGEVVTSNRGLSLPLNKDEWSSDKVPSEGDELVVAYGPYSERGCVIDRMVASFHGTHLVWRHVKDRG